MKIVLSCLILLAGLVTTQSVNADVAAASSCYRKSCAVWVEVVKSEQKIYVYEKGQLLGSWAASTGKKGHETPDFDKRPNGRMYESYSSTQHPGGGWARGNMPWSVFIEGGYALHGTGPQNWIFLGSKASHGCVRMMPKVAKSIYRMIQKYGIGNSWITVHN